MEETCDQEEWDDDLKKQEAPHHKGRKHCHKTVYKTWVKAVDTGKISSTKEC